MRYTVNAMAHQWERMSVKKVSEKLMSGKEMSRGGDE